MAEKTVEQRCYEALKARGVTFAAAESCTGGLIAKRIRSKQHIKITAKALMNCLCIILTELL